MRLRLLIAVALIPGLCAPFIAAQSPHSAALVIVHVTVIDPGTSSVEGDRTVVVRGDRIASVSSSKSFHALAGGRVVDGTGKFLIPGLWDMHVHTAFGDWFPGGRDVILPLFIANGVTGVRDMGGDVPVLQDWRNQIEAGQLTGPRMIYSGPMLDGYLPDGKNLRFPSSVAVTSPAEARAAVDSLVAQDVDFIKVQSLLSLESYLAAADEARKRKLPIVGHVPDKVRITQVVAAGQKSIEHLMGLFEGCSGQEDKFIRGEGSTELLLTANDPKKCDNLIKLLAKTQTWQVPTLTWQRGGTFLDQLDWKHQPLDRYVPAYWRDVTWRRFHDAMMPDLLKDPLPLRREYFALNLQMVAKLHRAGVPFLAGTDTAAGIYVMPGFSLHDELANFVEAGFAPMEALQTATSNPAKFLGRNDAGKIAANCVADLVLLNADPLENIRNTEKIDAVIANGKFSDRTALDQLLSDVATAASRTKRTPR
jgi:imidazolonepropionase-like amidohydrolase